jgi:hypothetical protein
MNQRDAFLLDEGDAARELQCVHRQAAIAYTAAPALETYDFGCNGFGIHPGVIL